MFFSYVMGVGKEILILKKQGFKIKRKRKDYTIMFPKDKADIWEEFISNHLDVGYWNEYMTENKVIFLFNLNNDIKRYEVENFDNPEVLQLCEKLCDCKFESIKNMLTSNKFYKKILMDKSRI